MKAEKITMIDDGVPWNGMPARPWSRLLAKLIDVPIFSFVAKACLYVLFAILPADTLFRSYTGIFWEFSWNVSAYAVIAALCWPLTEAFSISLTGSTIGKGVLGIRIISEDGSSLPLWRSIKRSYGAFFIGLGLMLPLLSILTLLLSYRHLRETGSTFWDQAVHSRYISQPVDVWAWGLAFILLLMTTMRFSIDMGL